LVSGNCHKPKEPIAVSKHENLPCFCRHSFDWRKDRSTSSVIFSSLVLCHNLQGTHRT
jgi:hypothetical protein